MRQYPHQLSGGMRQRVMIAMALSCNPKLLIADEPTTALDVTIQAQILDLMRELKAKTGAAIVLITHDLGVVAEMAQRVVVMYAGRKVEEAPVDALFARPLHPYTKGLLGSIPRLAEAAEGGERKRLVEIPGMVPSLKEAVPGCLFAPRCPHATARCAAEYPPLEEKAAGPLGRVLGGGRRWRYERAAPGARPAQALPGAQGRVRAPGRRRCTPSTASAFRSPRARRSAWSASRAAASRPPARLILRLIEPTAGDDRVATGSASTRLARAAMRPFRRELQMVFQDPYSSLNPRMRAADIVAEPLRNYERLGAAAVRERVGVALREGRPAPGPDDRTRTSSRAASASASASRARSRCGRS